MYPLIVIMPAQSLWQRQYCDSNMDMVPPNVILSMKVFLQKKVKIVLQMKSYPPKVITCPDCGINLEGNTSRNKVLEKLAVKYF